MNWWEILFSVIAAIGLFTHSLEGFSKRLKTVATGAFKATISKISSSKLKAFSLGFLATAVLQSSSAVLAIVVSFVDAGILSFSHTLPVILGCNLGTTITAWLVSFKLDFLGILLISIGFVLGFFSERIKLVAKPIFYLGLILFSLQLISNNLEPLKNSSDVITFLEYAESPWIGILLGMLITAITQSSSVAIGLAVILCGQQVLTLDSAIGIIVGSNLGTTTTAFIASLKLGKQAKKTALVNFYFNLFGVLLYLPLARIFVKGISKVDASLEIKVALAHLIFNLAIAILLLPFTQKIARVFTKSKT